MCRELHVSKNNDVINNVLAAITKAVVVKWNGWRYVLSVVNTKRYVAFVIALNPKWDCLSIPVSRVNIE